MQIWLDVLRYTHILAGITWIGILYYFNFVQVPSFAKMEPSARANAIMILVPRALLFFRYSALLTFLAGLAYVVTLISDIGDAYTSSGRYKSILIGGTLGTIMFLNVWGIIWPNQKKIIAATTATFNNKTPAPPEQPKWARRAFLASRFNTMLSIPMLFFMVAAIHLPKLWE